MLKWLFFSPVAFAVMLVTRTLGLWAPAPSSQHHACPQVAVAEPASVLGVPLAPCPAQQATGFFRDGYCRGSARDPGAHVVCAQVTDPFLAFTKARGNDLSTPRPGFAGLQAGDGWCLCAERWREAAEAGVAPPVVLEATDAAALRHVTRQSLDAHPLEAFR